jgi:hypothetical protein
MNIKALLTLIPVAVAALIVVARAQSVNTSTPALPQSPSNSVAQDPAAKFSSMLSNAVLSGRWCLVQNGELTPDKQDTYRIESASKLAGDSWLIRAHVEYGTNSFVAPIPVQVKFAGDTPVIVVDNLTVPGGGTYSARVLFHDNTYSGTWSGGRRVGLLHGFITHPAPTNSATETPAR